MTKISKLLNLGVLILFFWGQVMNLAILWDRKSCIQVLIEDISTTKLHSLERTF